MPILVICDKKTGYIACHVVVSKGNHKYAVKCLRDEMDIMGYKRLICKSDQESSILSLKEAVKREWPGEMMMEDSPVG